MSDYDAAFDRLMALETFKLTDIKGDKGGQTYAGITRRSFPHWDGWAYIERGDTPPTQMVREFYLDNFWNKLRLSEIANQDVARHIFVFAANTGPATATKLAQVLVGASADGALGDKTLALLNACDPVHFSFAYSLAKIARYRDIVTKDRTQIKFLLGWINRTLKEA